MVRCIASVQRWLWPLLLAEAAAATETAGCPVRLLSVEPTAQGHGAPKEDPLEGLRLAEEGLEYLRQQRSPLYLVPALGVYRGGKSLLLNRLMGLRAPYTGGFGVGHGQHTFTRGIDICAERVEGLGTVVWMDTEGLFSSEDARSAYGPKIFSLALLFSSSVLLNSVKVLNDQFFGFFAEQQQIARVLKQGLDSEGLPKAALLPGNLSVFWVLQQPIRYDDTHEASRAQLKSFLSLPGDESRARVQRDFNHVLYEVPTAVHDVRKWGRLDSLGDEELLPEYVASAEELRAALLSSLRGARPAQAESVTKQLRMYAELVRTERFSGTLAKEAFEEEQIGSLCGRYSEAIAEHAGALPSPLLQDAFELALGEVEARRSEAAEAFHLDADFSRRLDRCLRGREEETNRQNAELVLAQFEASASAVAEEGGCFFLGRLTRLIQEREAFFGETFGADMQARALDYSSALQRTRLVECVRLRDFLWPFAPWLAWPICSFYIRGGTLSGLLSMLLHGVLLAGIYVVLQLFHQLPGYLDSDYPVLRKHPALLDLAMRAPPMVPWSYMARGFGLLGAMRSGWLLLRSVAELIRPAGQGHHVGQLVNLELKLNVLLKRSEAAFKQDLAAAALEASEQLERGGARAAARALLRGLCLLRDLADDDRTLSVFVDARLRKRSRDLLARFRLPSLEAKESERLCAACRETDLVGLVARGDWGKLLNEMALLLERLVQGASDSRQGTPCNPCAGARPSPVLRSSPSPTSDRVSEGPLATPSPNPSSIRRRGLEAAGNLSSPSTKAWSTVSGDPRDPEAESELEEDGTRLGLLDETEAEGVAPAGLDESGVFGEDALDGSVPAELDESGIFESSQLADEEASESGIFERSQLTNEEDEKGDDEFGKDEMGDDLDSDVASQDVAVASGASRTICFVAIMAVAFAAAAWGLKAAGQAGLLLLPPPDVGGGTAASADGASHMLDEMASVAAFIAVTAFVWLVGAKLLGLG